MLGPQHPDTLRSRNNLAVGYRTLGAKEVVQLAEETPSNSNPICPMARRIKSAAATRSQRSEEISFWIPPLSRVFPYLEHAPPLWSM